MGDCRLSPHEAFSDGTCANTAPISEVGGGVSIDTRRCAASSDTASSVALYALTVWTRVFQPRAPSEKGANVCLQAGHSAVWDRSEVGGGAADTDLPRLKEDARRG